MKEHQREFAALLPCSERTDTRSILDRSKAAQKESWKTGSEGEQEKQ